MITPSFGVTATERVLPKLALDFTTASLDPRITFTRTGATATRVNASGIVEAMAANTPRFDFNPTTLACQGLLIEEARTNTLQQSSNFSTAPWQLIGTPVLDSGITDPSGNTNTVYYPTVSEIVQYFDGANSTAVAFSFFGKKRVGTGNDAIVFEVFQQVSGAVVSLGNFEFQLIGANPDTTYAKNIVRTSYPNGWYRFTCRLVSNAGAGAGVFTNSSRLDIQGDAAQNYIWGMQMEVGTFATSYIPTTTTALTRNADVAVMTGTNFSDWFNASEGGAVIQVLPCTISGTRPAVEFDDNTANETIVLRGVAADPQLYVVDGGAAQATLDAGTITANEAYRLAGAWKSSSFATAINGAASVSQLSGTYPTVTQARFGSDGTNYLNGWLQNFRYWPQRITNAETQAFSK